MNVRYILFVGQAHTYQLAQEGEKDDSWVPKPMVGKHLSGRYVSLSLETIKT